MTGDRRPAGRPSSGCFVSAKKFHALKLCDPRKGIDPDELQKKGVKLYVSDISSAKDYARYDKEFREIFGLK